MTQKILCVAEKPAIAKAVAQHLSGGRLNTKAIRGNQYVKNYEFDFNFRQWGNAAVVMTSVLGHLTSLDFDPQFKGWRSCAPGQLFDAPTQTTIDQDKKAIADNIRQLARSARILYIWTDCDREGEHIGTEVKTEALKANSGITVKRALFSNTEKVHVVQAAHSPIDLDERQANAVAARIELDLRIGASFTRLQTLQLQNVSDKLAEKVISYGSCQFPTLGFVVDRYNRVRNFKPEAFWLIKVNHVKEGINVSFSWRRVHLFDRAAVVILFEQCIDAKKAKVIKVQQKPTSKWRPLPLTTVELQMQGSRFLRMSSSQVMKVAEQLYTKGWISYPRTETDRFSKDFDLQALIRKQVQDPGWGQYAQGLLDGAFQLPRQGRNDDKAHPPIHPVNWVAATALSDDERRVYEYVTRRFLACCSDDARGEATEIAIAWGPELFHTHGLTVLQRNYLDVYVYDRWESSQQLPAFSVGETLEPTEANMVDGKTTAPGYLTEPELIGLMDANGIGTDATMAEHIAKIKDRHYVDTRPRGGRGQVREFIPTTLGVALIEGYDNVGLDVSVSKPFLRKEMELKMKAICEGRKRREDVVQESLEEYRAVFIKTQREMGVLRDSVIKITTTVTVARLEANTVVTVATVVPHLGANKEGTVVHLEVSKEGTVARQVASREDTVARQVVSKEDTVARKVASREDTVARKVVLAASREDSVASRAATVVLLAVSREDSVVNRAATVVLVVSRVDSVANRAAVIRHLHTTSGAKHAADGIPSLYVDEDDVVVKTKEQPQLHAASGQVNAFPGLGQEDEDDELFYGPASDGIDYLRMVRSEAKGVPSLLRAPADADADAALAGSKLSSDALPGHYYDGVYIGPVSVSASADAMQSAQTRYHETLVAQFRLVQATLRCTPPLEAVEALGEVRPISFPRRSATARRAWERHVHRFDPHPVQVACMDVASVLTLLQLLRRLLVVRRFGERAEQERTRLGAWVWAAVGKCPHRGELGSEEIAARGVEHKEDGQLAAITSTAALVDMTLTIIGEVYGQRDLLDLRPVWQRAECVAAAATRECLSPSLLPKQLNSATSASASTTSRPFAPLSSLPIIVFCTHTMASSTLDPQISNGTCYYALDREAHPRYIPCGNAAFGHVPCCESADVCLSSLACYNGEHGVTYLAGCTDPTYQNKNCPDKEPYANQSWVGLSYCGNREWVGCANPRASQQENVATIVLVPTADCSCSNTAMRPQFTDANPLANYLSLPTAQGLSYAWAFLTPTVKPSSVQPSVSTVAGAAAGSAVGFIILVAAIAGLVLYWRRKKRRAANGHGGPQEKSARPDSNVYTDDVVGSTNRGGPVSPSYQSELPGDSITSPSVMGSSTLAGSVGPPSTCMRSPNAQSEVEGSPVPGPRKGRELPGGGFEVAGQRGTYYEMILRTDPRIIPFFQSFYATSDDGSDAAHTAYVEYLTPSATLIMGTRRADGHAQILALRKGLWAADGPVVSRKHTVGQLYPFGPDSLDVVLYGVVDYALRNGKTGVRVDWAARAVFEEGGDGDEKVLRMKFYQVYLDSGVVAAAMKD
ncbi:hypothetical protein DV737_g3785, partial [Chaetothyriales sp. CBS 132003]